MKRLFMAAGLFAGAVLVAAPAAAQDYPSREIHVVCGFVAGSGSDVIHRYFAEKLRQVTGKPVVVDNKPGAAGTLATQFVAKSKPDGYNVLLSGGSGIATAVHLFKTVPADPIKDFEPLTALLRQPWVLLVDAKSPFKTLPELTAHLKAKGAKSSYSTSTTVGAVMGELYKATAGLQTVQVNYRTIGDSLNDLLSGNIDVILGDAAFALGQMRNGTLRALATSSAQRMKSMADVPTMAEGGVPMDLVVWWAGQVAAGTPKPVVDKLNGYFLEVLKMEETEKFLANIGTDVFTTTPEQTRALIQQDITKWGEYVRTAKIDPS